MTWLRLVNYLFPSQVTVLEWVARAACYMAAFYISWKWGFWNFNYIYVSSGALHVPRFKEILCTVWDLYVVLMEDKNRQKQHLLKSLRKFLIRLFSESYISSLFKGTVLIRMLWLMFPYHKKVSWKVEQLILFRALKGECLIFITFKGEEWVSTF